MNNAMYDVTLSQAANMIRLTGKTNTTLVQGHMGTGKSSMLKMLGSMLPTHRTVYFDCTTKDLGDLMLPKVQSGEYGESDYVQFVPNEELGLHLDGPIILMIDEFGKANPAVKLGVLRLMLERKQAGKALHPDSIIFATTNLGSEGVGDLLPAHARNRITVVRVRKPTVDEWVEDYALDAGIDPVLLAWAMENPQIMDSFENVDRPDDNEYIFHPKATGRVSFVTPRTLELASHWLKQREHMSGHELTAALVGTIGGAAALNLAAYVKIGDQLPSLDSIKQDPDNTKVPNNNTAICMVVHRTVQTLERNWTDAWMRYLVRLPREAQAMFANSVRRAAEKPNGVNKRLIDVNTNKKYQEWCLANNYMFAADKK